MVEKISRVADILRRDVIEMTTEAGSGHLSSCLSAAEIVATLFFGTMAYDTKNAFNPDNDEFVLSKGHAAPILYSALQRAGCINTDLLKLRKFGGLLEGHPVPSDRLPWVKVATGSLGQGLGVGVGMALAARLQERNYRTYVLLGDSECAEGSVWEAAELASYYHLGNLCAIVDVNKLGQRGETMLAYNLKAYAARFKSFGWHTIIVNGHDVSALQRAFAEAKKKSVPTAILAKTIKGKGIRFIEGKLDWHGHTLSREQCERALNDIPPMEFPDIQIVKPKKLERSQIPIKLPYVSDYKLGYKISTREAYGNALAKLCFENKNVTVLDAEVSNSTYAGRVKEVSPKSFIESFIAEQNMISMALGLAVKGQRVFASTFSAFLTRAHDQLRMAALSGADLVVCGSHSGVSVGDDGASQMGLEDVALFRTLPGATILQPSDGVSAEKIVNLAAKTSGVVYIRTARPKLPTIYNRKEVFAIEDFKILHQSFSDKIVLAGSGVTLQECLVAQQVLARYGVHAAVVDLYCVEPFPAQKLLHFVKTHGNAILTVEDHYFAGGIGERVASAFINENVNILPLSVNKVPHSGTKEDLYDFCGLNAENIVRKALFMIEHKHFT